MLIALVVAAGGAGGAQPLAPGYVDPQPVLAGRRQGDRHRQSAAASPFPGTGYAGAGRPAARTDRNVDWPRGDSLANYTRTMNWDARTMKEEFDRKPGLNPASWKYGLGWIGGTPLQQNSHQIFMVNGNVRLAHGRPGQRAGAGAARTMRSDGSSTCGSTRTAS